MECDIGKLINEKCHKSVYGEVPKHTKVIGKYSDEEKLLIQLRVSNTIVNISTYHELKFLKNTTISMEEYVQIL